MSLKISLPGFDVKTASPEQMAIDSDYDTLKIPVDDTSSKFGQILVTFADNPGVGVYPLFTYKHGFSYMPFYYFFFDFGSSSKLLGSNSGFDTGTKFSNDVFSDQFFQFTDTGDGFTLSWNVISALSDMTGNFFSFRYFVFANDGV